MKYLIAFIAILFSDSVWAQTIPAPASIAQTTNQVSQSTYISPFTSKYISGIGGGNATNITFLDGTLIQHVTVSGSNQFNFTGQNPSTIGLNATNLNTLTSNGLASLIDSIVVASNAISNFGGIGTNTFLTNAIAIDTTNLSVFSNITFYSDVAALTAIDSSNKVLGANPFSFLAGGNGNQLDGRAGNNVYSFEIGGLSNNIGNNAIGSGILGGRYNGYTSRAADNSLLLAGISNSINDDANISIVAGLFGTAKYPLNALLNFSIHPVTTGNSNMIYLGVDNGVAINTNVANGYTLEVNGPVDSTVGFTINGVPVLGGGGVQTYSNVSSIFFTPTGNILSTTNMNNSIADLNNSAILWSGNSSLAASTELNSLIVGGDNISFSGSFVSNSISLGGEGNVNAGANNSVALGGLVNQNSAGADNSIVGGAQAFANHASTMVVNMSDSSQTLQSITPFQFMLGANCGLVLANVTNQVALAMNGDLDINSNNVMAGGVSASGYFLNGFPISFMPQQTNGITQNNYWVTNCVGLATNLNGMYIYYTNFAFSSGNLSANNLFFFYTNSLSSTNGLVVHYNRGYLYSSFIPNNTIPNSGIRYIGPSKGYVSGYYNNYKYSAFSDPTNQPLVVLTNVPAQTQFLVAGSTANDGSVTTNIINGTIIKTNFLLGAVFTNTSVRQIQVVGNARCNPTTTANALFGLAIDPNNSGTFLFTNEVGLESDTIYTTVPHAWFQLTGLVPSGGRYKFIDVTGEGNVTVTNSFYEILF